MMSVRNCAELGKNLQKIVTRLVQNQDLCKLLYYTDKDPLNQPEVDSSKIINNLISVIPKFNPVEQANAHVILALQNASKVSGNEDFRYINFIFYVYVPITQWIIKNENLRPFLILQEIENSLNGKNINGLGKLKSGDIDLNSVTQQMTCYTLNFYLTDFN